MPSLDPNQYLLDSTIIYSRHEVNIAIDQLAEKLNLNYLNDLPVVLCVMSGGIYFTGQLLPKLKFPLEFDYVHATRYHGITGKALTWLAKPKDMIRNRNVLILDDILDEGITLKAISDECISLGAKKISIAVLVDKKINKEKPIKADYVGLSVLDRYVFGCGMDINGWWRNLPDIYSLNDALNNVKNN